LAFPDLLIASHIVSWARDKANRVNPRNGLCLNALHDCAFDRGLITLNSKLRVKSSPVLKAEPLAPITMELLLGYEGVEIRSPERFAPDVTLLDWHRKNIFRGN